MRIVALDAHDQTDSMRNLDGSSISGCMFWSMDCSWVWHMLHHVFKIHLSLVNWTLLKQVIESMTVGTSRIDHWCWVDLVH